MDVWPTLSEGKPSARQDVVYSLEPFRTAVCKGDWKLVWRTVLLSKVELFNLALDPAEQINLADQNPEKVAELQRWAETLAREAAPALFLKEAFGVVREVRDGVCRVARRRENDRKGAVTRRSQARELIARKANDPRRPDCRLARTHYLSTLQALEIVGDEALGPAGPGCGRGTC